MQATLYAIDNYMQMIYSLKPIISFTSAINAELRNLELIRTNIKEDPLLSEEHKMMVGNATENAISFARWHTPGNRMRRKRGLVNFMGNIQHALFRVIDEQMLDKRLNELNSRLDTITHSYDSSATTINTIQHNMYQLKEAVTQLDQKVRQERGTDELKHFA